MQEEEIKIKKSVDNYNRSDMISEVVGSDITVYKVKDIQRIFDCGINQAYQIVHSSGFPKIRIGNKIYIPKDNFEKWLSRNIGKDVVI